VSHLVKSRNSFKHTISTFIPSTVLYTRISSKRKEEAKLKLKKMKKYKLCCSYF